jgi:transcriptional regulator with GAF, ATPase, and Fis domain
MQGGAVKIDDNEFFREATLRLCGSLDINEALLGCSHYIRQFVPLSRIYIVLFDPDMHVSQILSSAKWEGWKGVVGHTPIHIPERFRTEWQRHWDGYVIMNDHSSEEWFWDHMRDYGYPQNVSVLIMRLKIGPSLCMVGLIEDGQGVYTEEHAHLITLLKEPFAIAIVNALRHKEILQLRDLLADEQRRLLNRMKGLSSEIIGKQVGLQEAIEKCRRVALLDSPVLLLGETGVGKDLFAHTIHNLSPRSQGPLISVNCGAITETLVDSELFGHEKGAFTGAITQKMGRFERANKGTIYLDEVGELTPQAQVRLLRVLQYKEIERVGGKGPVPVDTRVIAATNRDLEGMVKSGEFRKDLWYRLNVFPITVPPLRERRLDIPELLCYFIEMKRKELKMDITPKLAPNAISTLMSYDWPGNIRELQNIVERALITNVDGVLRLDELLGIKTDPKGETNSDVRPDARPAGNVQNLDQANAAHIRQAMNAARGKINGPGGAAELLGIHPNTLRKRMDKLGIPYKRQR